MNHPIDPSDQNRSASRSFFDRTLLKRIATPATVGYWLALYIGTHIPNPKVLDELHVSDKTLHFSAYFGLYLLLAVRIRIIHESWPTGRQTIALFLLTSLYSAFDEITQGLPMINRHPDVLDAVADCTGVIAAILAVRLIAWSEKRIWPPAPTESTQDS